jgi:hypothetical protein
MKLRLIVVALAAPVTLAAQGPRPALPDARTLIARHDSLVGGRAALEPHQSMRTVGTFSFPLAGIEAPLEVLKLRPDRFLTRISVPNFGDVLQGFDGDVAWAVQPGQPPQILEGFAAQRMREQADFFGNLHRLSLFASIETVADTVFEGIRVYKVRLTRPEGDIIYEYFNVATGLSAGGSSQVVTAAGPVENITVFAEYRVFGSLQLATKILQRAPQTETLFTVVDVEFDTVDSAAVAAPEAVRALRSAPRPPSSPDTTRRP